MVQDMTVRAQRRLRTPMSGEPKAPRSPLGPRLRGEDRVDEDGDAAIVV